MIVLRDRARTFAAIVVLSLGATAPVVAQSPTPTPAEVTHPWDPFFDDTVLHEIRLAVKYKPQDPAYVCNLGKLLISARKLDDAIEAFQQTLRLDSDYADAHNALGAALALPLGDAARSRPRHDRVHADLGHRLDGRLAAIPLGQRLHHGDLPLVGMLEVRRHPPVK